MKFKNYIETESGIKDTSTSPGTAGQVLSSTVTGTSWIDPDTLVSAASKLVVISCKNVSGAQILKGTPVYQSGTVGATDVIEVEPADATISTGYLPAIGILQTTLNNNGFGNVVITGEFLNYSTADIPTDRPGGDPFTGDTVYLAAGGGLTCIKPTGAGNAIQNVGLIGKVSGGNSGSITVSSIMRANDVPNLPEGRIWIGDGNTIVSDTVYVDEPNNRVGINTAMPTYDLDVDGAIRASEGFIDNEDNSALRVVSPPGGSFRSAFTTVGAIEVTIPNSYVKNDVTFTLEVREGGLTAYTIKIAMRGNIGIDLFPYVVSAYLTSDANKDNNCTIKYESLVPEFDDVKIYVQNPSLGFPSNTGVFITEFTVPATVADGNLAWGLNITSVPAEANATFSNTQVTNWKRNGQDLYYGSGSGNVGIGTTAPGTYKLAVAGSTVIGGNVKVSDGLGGDEVLTLTPNTGSFKIGDIDGVGDEGYIEGDSSSIKFFTGGSQTLVCDINQRVGIGTTTPSEKLVVRNGTSNTDVKILAYNSAAGTEATLKFSTINSETNYEKAAIIARNPDGSWGRSDMHFALDSAEDSGNVQFSDAKMTILNGGNVGIGTTSPATKLHVSGGDIRIDDTERIEFGAGGVRINNDAAGRMYYRAPLGFYWETNGGYRMVINSTGNVGIGTTSPGTYRLAVAGSTAIGENLEVSDGLGGDKTLSIDATIGAFQIGDIDGIGDGAHIEGDSSNIKIFTGSGEKVRVNLSGNVGIGTPAPLAKLQVEGNANIGLLHTNFAGASFNVNLGFENYNNGFAAIATGQNTLADASQSFSMGFQSKATGAASLAGGNVNIITALPSESAGEASIAFGNGVKTNSNANYSQAFGRGTETGGGLTSANQAMAMGFNSIAFGDNSFSGGNNSRAFGEASFAFGEGAVGSKGDGNIALGIGVTTPNNGSAAYSSGQVAVGAYNVWGTGQPLSFSVGNGFSDSQRLTALCVNRNTGNTGMGNVFNPQSKLQVNGGIQLAFDGSTPSLAKVGTFRYRKSGNNTYVDMCMQTGASTYAWVNIVTNSW